MNAEKWKKILLNNFPVGTKSYHHNHLLHQLRSNAISFLLDALSLLSTIMSSFYHDAPIDILVPLLSTINIIISSYHVMHIWLNFQVILVYFAAAFFPTIYICDGCCAGFMVWGVAESFHMIMPLERFCKGE